MSLAPLPAADPAEPRLPLPEVPTLEARWQALCEAGDAVAALAGEGPIRDVAMSDLLATAPVWRRARAAPMMVDLAAIMRAGLAALLAARARGGEAQAAAGALLYEFGAAQQGLRGMLAPEG